MKQSNVQSLPALKKALAARWGHWMHHHPVLLLLLFLLGAPVFLLVVTLLVAWLVSLPLALFFAAQ